MSLHMQALESQLSALTMVRQLIKLSPQLKEAQDLLAGWQVDEKILTRAKPFAWSTDVTQAVLQASKSIPLDTVLNEINFDVNAAQWWYFERPLAWVTNDSGLGVRALGFSRARYVDKGGLVYRFATPCHVWTDDKFQQRPVTPSQTWDWEDDITLGEMLERVRGHHRKLYGPGGPRANAPQVGEDVFMAATEGLARFVLAGLAWLQQSILMPEVEHVERHRRKDFERQTKQTLDGVRVVRLRRRIYDETPHQHTGEEKSVEWACRWVVNGHFRNQAHGPERKQRKLIYIMPFVKGPQDKPLKTTETVYVVDR